MNLLSSLRPDIIKLDMRLVRDVDRDRYKAGITSMLLEMARKLGIATVAEGIESPGEFEWFRDHGADYAQGYLIARPASPPPRPFSDEVSIARPRRSDVRPIDIPMADPRDWHLARIRPRPPILGRRESGGPGRITTRAVERWAAGSSWR